MHYTLKDLPPPHTKVTKYHTNANVDLHLMSKCTTPLAEHDNKIINENFDKENPNCLFVMILNPFIAAAHGFNGLNLLKGMTQRIF